MAIALVKKLSSTPTWYSLGPITLRMWRQPAPPSSTRLCQYWAPSMTSSAPCSRRNWMSPVQVR